MRFLSKLSFVAILFVGAAILSGCDKSKFLDVSVGDSASVVCVRGTDLCWNVEVGKDTLN